jgi:hypothetical protein
MFCLMHINRGTGSVTTAPLASWQQLYKGSKQQQDLTTAAQSPASQQDKQQQQQGDEELLLVMFDPCHLPLTPGWPLRNVLLLAAARWRLRQLRVLCVRDSSAGRAAVERSYVLQVRLLICNMRVTHCTCLRSQCVGAAASAHMLRADTCMPGRCMCGTSAAVAFLL